MMCDMLWTSGELHPESDRAPQQKKRHSKAQCSDVVSLTKVPLTSAEAATQREAWLQCCRLQDRESCCQNWGRVRATEKQPAKWAAEHQQFLLRLAQNARKSLEIQSCTSEHQDNSDPVLELDHTLQCQDGDWIERFSFDLKAVLQHIDLSLALNSPLANFALIGFPL